MQDKDSAPRVGSPAPDFALPDQTNTPVRLADYRGRRAVVLFFYPKDYSPICTLEAIAFREAYGALQAAGAEVLGVSDDPPQSHASFCDRLRLPFKLLADAGHEVRDRYGARGALGWQAPRVTYVIDRDGILRARHVAAFGASGHVRAALAALGGTPALELDGARRVEAGQ